jgi:hypothetical protein
MATYPLGDGPIEPAYVTEMTAIAKALDEIFNGQLKGNDRPTGFALMVFPFGERTGRCNFISNGANREDLVVLFKEMIARFEGQPEVKGSA